jgi:hypothetical protein
MHAGCPKRDLRRGLPDDMPKKDHWNYLPDLTLEHAQHPKNIRLEVADLPDEPVARQEDRVSPRDTIRVRIRGFDIN